MEAIVIITLLINEENNTYLMIFTHIFGNIFSDVVTQSVCWSVVTQQRHQHQKFQNGVEKTADFFIELEYNITFRNKPSSLVQNLIDRAFLKHSGNGQQDSNKTVTMFDPMGSFYRSFRREEKSQLVASLVAFLATKNYFVDNIVTKRKKKKDWEGKSKRNETSPMVLQLCLQGFLSS